MIYIYIALSTASIVALPTPTVSQNGFYMYMLHTIINFVTACLSKSDVVFIPYASELKKDILIPKPSKRIFSFPSALHVSPASG